MLKITLSEYQWLQSRADRDINDVGEDEIGKFVFMGNGDGKTVRVYIPKNFKWINHMDNIKTVYEKNGKKRKKRLE